LCPPLELRENGSYAGCIAQASTFSTTARAWGLDVERASKRARPDFDGLV